MSASTTSRGPLSPGVYWRRRLFVLGLAAALVVLVAGVIRGGSDGASGDPGPGAAAVQAGAEPSATESSTERPRRERRGRERGQDPSPALPMPTPTPLAEPSGPCPTDDVVITPVVDEAVAGSDVTVVLELGTIETEACTWRLSPQHATVTITSGEEEIWASRECSRAVPTQDVVLRRGATIGIGLVWNARRSNLGCPGRSAWALDGYYHVAAAALGGEPRDVQFELVLPGDVEPGDPEPSTTGQPTTGQPTTGQPTTGQPSGRPSDRPSDRPGDRPGDRPSGQGSPGAQT